MKKVDEFHCNCFYMFESLASGRSCYFESEEEIKIFKNLFTRYLKKYVKVYHMEISSEGYQILLKIKDKRTLISHYQKSCEEKGKNIKELFIQEPWHIISEQMRIFLSLFVRIANKLRGREGVLVKKSYERFLFESLEELQEFLDSKDEQPEIQSQSSAKYQVSNRWKTMINWVKVRAKNKVESLMNKAFKDLVALKLINSTTRTHSLSKFQTHSSSNPS